MNLEQIKNITEHAPHLIKALSPKRKEVIILNIEEGKEVYEVHNFSKTEIWPQVFDCVMEEIRTRPRPGDRVSDWELAWSEDPEKTKKNLLELRKHVKPRDRIKVNRRALNELCDYMSLKRWLGETYLAELKVCKKHGPRNEMAIAYAKSLNIW